MSNFENPFSNLVRREYNITNLKKILDTFPTSLDVKELTSNELLELLRERIQDKDIRIEELLAQLINNQTTATNLSNINDTVKQLRDELQLGDAIEDSLQQTADQARINSLLQRGYIQISDTPLYVKVNKGLTISDDFYIDHTDENAGFPESDMKAPNSISFVNVSETEDVWVKKVERWTSNLDGIPIPSVPTNAWKFNDYTDIHLRAYKISADSETTTPVSLYYKSKDDYKFAGLRRDNETNEWFGFMDLKVQIGSDDNIDNVSGVPIGNLRLYRDRN